MTVNQREKTIIIGLGNPYLADDGIGVMVVRELKDKLEGQPLTIMELPVGGLRLMEAMVGFDMALIIDAMITKKYKPGTVKKIAFADFNFFMHATSSHDTSLGLALEFGRQMGLHLPGEITLWGIEANSCETFGEPMSQEVFAAVGPAVLQIMKDLKIKTS